MNMGSGKASWRWMRAVTRVSRTMPTRSAVSAEVREVVMAIEPPSLVVYWRCQVRMRSALRSLLRWRRGGAQAAGLLRPPAWQARRAGRRSSTAPAPRGGRDRKSVVQGKSVDLGGRRIIKKKKISEVSISLKQKYTLTKK